MTFTPELAFALGVRDRIMGVDADARRTTVERFNGCTCLEHAYYSGWIECNHYCDNQYKWGASTRPVQAARAA